MLVELRLDDALPGGEGGWREEPGDAVLHREQGFAVHRAFKPEPEQPRIRLVEELVDVDVVNNRLADRRQAAVERHHGIQEPINCNALSLKVDAEEPGQEQVGLPGFDGHASGAPPRVQVPPARMNRVVRDHATRLQRQRLAFDTTYVIDQHERAVRQPHPRGERINRGKRRPEYVTNFAGGEPETIIR